MKYLYIFLIIVLLTGCSLWPKKVEYFQDKVAKMPTQNKEHVEARKEAADYVARKTKETVNAALDEDSSTNVLKPAFEAELVAGSLSGSLGKPMEQWQKSDAALARKLDSLDAKLDRRLEEFREENDKNAGKKIEGTGLFQIGYFTQFLVFAIIAVVAYAAIKVIGLFNPAVQVGSQVLSGGIRGVTKIATKGFSQLISAGEDFKRRIDSEIDDPKTKEQILYLFKQCHLAKQDSEVQQTIKKLTNPDVE